MFDSRDLTAQDGDEFLHGLRVATELGRRTSMTFNATNERVKIQAEEARGSSERPYGKRRGNPPGQGRFVGARKSCGDDLGKDTKLHEI